MAVLNNTNILQGASISAETGPYNVKRSARFNSGDSSSLSWTPAAAGNRKKWTFSCWVKRLQVGTAHVLFDTQDGSAGTPRAALSINASNILRFAANSGGSSWDVAVSSHNLLRDVSAWYHIVTAVDTDNATATNRVKLYINGVQVSYNETTYPTQIDLPINQALGHRIGSGSGNSLYLNGYLADIHFIDGAAEAPTDFAEADSTTGQWVPKKYTGSYGTNGFHLAMDPANGGTIWSSGAERNTSHSSYPISQAFDGSLSTYAMTANSNGDSTNLVVNLPGLAASKTVRFYGYQNTNAGTLTFNGGAVNLPSGNSNSKAWVTAANQTNGSSDSFSMNVNAGSSISDDLGVYAVEVDGKILVDHSAIGYDSSGNGNHWHENNLFGREHSTANENFKAVEWIGNATAGRAINCGFAPDFVWIKRADGTGNHTLWPKQIHPNRLHTDGPWAEGDGTSALSAFTSTGITIGSHLDTNGDDKRYIGWFWKGGGTPSTLTAGSINTEVSANTSHGFSVMTYTGTGPSSSGTVAHGLGKKPDMIIAKKRNGSTNWYVWHSSTASNINTKYALLNTNDKVNQAAGDLFATVGTTTFGVEAGSNTNNDGNMLALCFSEIEGYSKFGHYIGNNNATGPVINCGFTPAFVFLRRVDDDNNWQIFDNARDTNKDLKPNTDEIEGTAEMDFLSYGFQPRNTYTSTNANDGEYIYMAIAGSPRGDLDLLADTPGAPYDNELNGGGNYATLNPLAVSIGSPITNGGLGMAKDNGGHQVAAATIAVSSGKWWWEATIKSLSPDYICFGMWDTSKKLENTLPGYSNTDSWSVQQNTGKIYYNGHYKSTTISSFAAGDHVAVAYDNGSCYVYKNGIIENSGNPVVTGLKGHWAPIFHGVTNSWEWEDINFGQREFRYTPRSGHLALNAYNLATPDETVVPGNKGFDVREYPGTGSAHAAVTDLEFSPDLVWTKGKDVTSFHALFDRIRDVHNALRTTTTGNTYTDNGLLTVFGDNGFSVGTAGDINTNNKNFVSWNWDAGTSPVTKSAGSLNSTAYDQRYDWSDYITGTPDSNYPLSNCFGSGLGAGTSNGIRSTNPGTLTLNISSLNLTVGTVRLHPTMYNQPSTFAVNGTTITNPISNAYNHGPIDFVVDGAINTIAWSYDGSSGPLCYMRGIEFDGKLLQDTDSSVSSPSVSTTYRANPNTGFSVVTFTDGSSSGLQNIAHGLNTTPAFIVLKNRDDTSDWSVFHQDFPDDAIYFDKTNAKFSSSRWNGIAGTSNIFYWNDNSTNSDDLVAYVWSEVPGYSKFGSWVSIGNTFVYCGFRPRFLMAKAFSKTGDWVMYDTSRDPFNRDDENNTLVVNVDKAVDDHYDIDQTAVDILSNGFMIRHGGSAPLGDSGETYAFAAWSELPFKYANAR